MQKGSRLHVRIPERLTEQSRSFFAASSVSAYDVIGFLRSYSQWVFCGVASISTRYYRLHQKKELLIRISWAGVRVSQTTGAASRVFLQFLSASVEHAKGFVLLDSKKENVDHLHALVHRHAWSYEVNIVGNSFARVLGAGLRRNASKPDLDVCGR
ncbi:hypothetical protein HBI56_182450 [Parastagonospora nodorum]|nr:hypothetical protein HBH56_187860 [Parastagonospora nodorum]KAH3959163.1 hypothetical protein HBH52_246380 [Parastagonospora nodorum]KAH3991052.1 hypothetical protein HBI10_239120 [Parastagonospora nodorum]KAH4051686.1 hypothetical protein HBH49_106730 [Parastagonospora nodorum]KAH4055977.1 hypothetical protein HBH50_242700 [Parastagonospora nodorum]